MRTNPGSTLRNALLGCLAISNWTSGADPGGHRWFDQVERDRDRGAGRVEDPQTWDVRRLQDDQDERAGRLRTRREFERLGEDRDRQLQLEALARQAQRTGVLNGREKDSVILSEPPSAPGVVMSPAAAQAEADQRALAEAGDKLGRMLRGTNAAEQRELRLLRRRLNREGRADEFDEQSGPVHRRYEQLRAGHRADYEKVRSRILGRP